MRARWAPYLGTFAGVAIAAVCGWFVVDRLAADWPEARHALASASAGWLIAGVVLAAAGMTTIAIGWHATLATLGHRMPIGATIAWYFAGEIGKYVPGGLWPIVGRAELARRGGVPRSAAYSSAALSLALLYLAAALVASVMSPFALDALDGPLAIVLLVPPVGLVCLHPRVTAFAVDVVGRVARRPLELSTPSFGEALALIARFVPAWLLIGTATWTIARALDPGASWGRVVLATAVAWLAGFAAVPVPGGVGVREAVFVALAGSLAPGVAGSTAVIARVCFIAVDAIGAALSARVAPRRPSSTAPAG